MQFNLDDSIHFCNQHLTWQIKLPVLNYLVVKHPPAPMLCRYCRLCRKKWPGFYWSIL